MKIKYNAIIYLLGVFLSGVFTSYAQTNTDNKLWLPSFYSDHMVLQRDTTIVAGFCAPDAHVSISIGENTATIKSDDKGNWKAILYGINAGGPYELTVSTDTESKVFKDVLIGDVWLASGQSNMERAPKYGTIDGWEEEKQNAVHENIRLFQVERNPQGQPQIDFDNHTWKHCTPENLFDFSSVGYFFAKYIHENQNIPIGIINSSFGGSRIETWMSKEALQKSGVEHEPIWSYEEFKEIKKQADLDDAYRSEIFEKVNVGERQGVHQVDFDDSSWGDVYCPQDWKENELKGSGYVWVRKKFTIEDRKALGDTCKIYFGRIMHGQETYLNEKKLTTLGHYSERNFHFLVPASALVEGENTLAVRLIRYWGESGGFMEDEPRFGLFSQQDTTVKIPLSGYWKYHNKIEPAFPEMPVLNEKPTLLFNGMIAPLTSLKVKGFLWYQGESNANNNAADYDDLLKAMITDWRQRFGSPKAPFLVVQLPNYREYEPSPAEHNWPRLREAQANALELPNVGLCTIIDLGNPKDVHPGNKKDVGYRLSLIARKLAYGQNLVYSGPMVKAVEFKGSKVVVEFEQVGKGLKSQDGQPLKEFSLAGKDQKFYWGTARIIGKTKVEVTCKEVQSPASLRYAWQDNPHVNLYNSENLPATSFRTDDWQPKNEK